jgi:hypothetical protein
MKHYEDKMQIEYVRWFKYQYPNIAIHHSPNGGFRTNFEAAQFKRMGTMAGFPDLFIMYANSSYHGLFIELKTAEGKQTEAQVAFEKKAAKNGYKYTICRDLEQFMGVVNTYIDDLPF